MPQSHINLALIAICASAGLLALWPGSSVVAAERVDLYVSRMAVNDTTPQTLEIALEAALAEFLVRATGEPAMAQGPVFQQLRERTEELVSERGYVTLPGRTAADGALIPAANALHVRFEPEAMRRALEAEGVRILSPVRPVTLAVLGLGQGAGFEWITEEDALGVADSLRDYAGRLGLPLRLPNAKPDNSLIAAAGEDLRTRLELLRANAKADQVLLGILEVEAEGRLSANWRRLAGSGLEQWTSQGENIEAALSGALTHLGQTLAAEAQAAPVGGGVQEFTIVGIRNFADWSRLWTRLKDLEGGQGLKPVRLEPDKVTLHTDLPGGPAALLLDPSLGDIVEAAGEQWRFKP